MASAPVLTHPPQTYSPAFFTALATLRAHGIADEHAGAAIALWLVLAAHGAREACITITSEGTVQFAWNRHRYYMDVEVHPDGAFEWFWSDRADNATQGTGEGTEAVLPEAFWRCLQVAGV